MIFIMIIMIECNRIKVAFLLCKMKPSPEEETDNVTRMELELRFQDVPDGAKLI